MPPSLQPAQPTLGMAAPPQPPQAAAPGSAGYTEVGLFWDYENLAVPRGHDASEASNRLRTLSLRFGQLVERRVYHDPSKIQSVAPQDRSRLDSAGFTLVECPTRNEKETVDKKIIVDVMHFAITRACRAQQACVILLTNDGDFAYMLSRLRDLQVKVVVVYMAGHAADSLLHACDHAVSWRDDVLCMGQGQGGGGSGGGSRYGGRSPPPGTTEAHAFGQADDEGYGYAPHAPPHGAEVSAHAVAANQAAKAALKASARNGASSGRAEAQRVRRQGERAAIRKAAAPRPEQPGTHRQRGHVMAGGLGPLGAMPAPRRKKASTNQLSEFGGEWSHGVDEWRNVDAWLETGGKAGGQRKAAKAAQKNKGKKLRRQADAGDDDCGPSGGYAPPAGAASWGGYTPLGCGGAAAGGWAEMAQGRWPEMAMRQGAKRERKAARNGLRVGTGMKKKQKKAGGVKKKVVRKGGKKKR